MLTQFMPSLDSSKTAMFGLNIRAYVMLSGQSQALIFKLFDVSDLSAGEDIRAIRVNDQFTTRGHGLRLQEMI